MLKVIIVSVVTMLFIVNTWGMEESYEESYLEGISVLGTNKIAYLSIQGNKIPMREGDTFPLSEGDMVETWQVMRIKQGSVILLKMNNGLTTELRLDSRLPLPVSEAEAEMIESQQPHLDDSKMSVKEKTFSGYRIVRTPFGSFTITDDTPIPPSQPLPAKPMITEGDVPPGHHIVQTPFGDFIVKDQE